MALSEAQKINLVVDLAVSNSFNSNYSQFNQNWFVYHMAEYYTSINVADADIRGKIKQFINDCKIIVDSKKNFTIDIKFSKAVLKTTLKRRVEIIYGALASKPELTLPINNGLLEFIIKRRFRAVMRMDYFVNPNSQGYFRYPDKCSKTAKYKINTHAANLWEEYDIYPPWSRLGKCFKLNSVSGVNDPIASINAIFKTSEKPCEGNLLDCARVLSVVYMDSLQEATDSQKLLKYLISKPDFNLTIPATSSAPAWNSVIKHITISSPTIDPENSQFITDKSAEGLFSKPNVEAKDLQVGDHVYIYNHPLYKVFNPSGSWRGEHALVYNLGNRNYRSKEGFLFGGHGKEGTLYQFYSAFMQELKTHIERAYEMAKAHLLFRQRGAIPDGINPIQGGTVIVDTSTTGARVFEYHVPITYHDYEKKGKIISINQFLIAHEPGKPLEFWIDKEIDMNKLYGNGRSTDPIVFKRTKAPPPGSTSIKDYALESYSIFYRKEGSVTDEHFDLFELVGTKIKLKQINIADLFNDPFAVVPGTSMLRTTQPRTDVSQAYLAFLKAQGAIS